MSSILTVATNLSDRRDTAENTTDILLQETGKVFADVLEDAGVYKCTAAGREQFMAFVDWVNAQV